MYTFVLFLHILGAAVWTGGHRVLALAVLPREPSVQRLLDFEQGYERVGMPALALQILTGLWMAWRLGPNAAQWLAPQTGPARAVALKLLLATTALIARHARFRVIPNLTAATLPRMAWHIAAVTLLSIGFVGAGVPLRAGGIGA